ncbi:hypothetical protein V565_352030, partial [Rhizoctonia solani 123E]
MKVLKEVSKGTTYELELPNDLKDRGIHPVFHASLLRIYVPNDDNKFPARAGTQSVSITDAPKEWASQTWEEYRDVKHLVAFDEYLELQGVDNVLKLPWTVEYGIEEQEFGPEDNENDAEQETNGIKALDGIIQVNKIEFNSLLDDLIYCRNMTSTRTPVLRQSTYFFTAGELVDCGVYRASLFCVRQGSLDTAGAEPPKYQAFRAMLRTISKQEEVLRPASQANVELLASTMRDLALALGGTIRSSQGAAPVNGTTINTSPTTNRPGPSAYTRPANIPTGPKALKTPLSERI